MSRLLAYIELIQKWNQTINLVSRKDIDRLLERHLMDSLSVEKLLNDGNVIDVGSGAGFPGLPLAICRPDLQFTLVERSDKRSRFLRLAKLALNLQNVSCIQKNLTPSQRLNKQFDTALARAVSDPAAMWRICRGHLVDSGRLVFFLSTLPNESMESFSEALEGLAGIDSEILDMRIPNVNKFHKVLIIEKK